MENIKIFKLVDGTLVIGKINADEQIVEGMEIMMLPGTTGGMNIAIVPIMYPFNKNEELVIDKSKYIASINANEELTSKYFEVKTGIITPNKSIITH